MCLRHVTCHASGASHLPAAHLRACTGQPRLPCLAAACQACSGLLSHRLVASMSPCRAPKACSRPDAPPVPCRRPVVRPQARKLRPCHAPSCRTSIRRHSHVTSWSAGPAPAAHPDAWRWLPTAIKACARRSQHPHQHIAWHKGIKRSERKRLWPIFFSNFVVDLREFEVVFSGYISRNKFYITQRSSRIGKIFPHALCLLTV